MNSPSFAIRLSTIAIYSAILEPITESLQSTTTDLLKVESNIDKYSKITETTEVKFKPIWWSCSFCWVLGYRYSCSPANETAMLSQKKACCVSRRLFSTNYWQSYFYRYHYGNHMRHWNVILSIGYIEKNGWLTRMIYL